MREVCNKLPKTTSGQPAFDRGEEIVRWKYYKPLLFMREQFMGRQMSGSLPEDAIENTNTSVDTGDEDDSLPNTEPTSPIGPTGPTPTETERPTRKRSAHVAGTSQSGLSKKTKQAEMFLQLEKDKIETLKNFMGGERDEWRAYVEALLHDLRQVKS